MLTQSSRFVARSVIGFALVLLLAGCGADKAFTPTVTTGPAPSATSANAVVASENAIPVSVILTDYRVSVFQTSYQVGKTYQFTIANNGAIIHGFTIEPDGATNQPLTNANATAEITSINPGESATLTWTFTSPGKLQIASHANNDYTQGMVKTGLVAN